MSTQNSEQLSESINASVASYNRIIEDYSSLLKVVSEQRNLLWEENKAMREQLFQVTKDRDEREKENEALGLQVSQLMKELQELRNQE